MDSLLTIIAKEVFNDAPVPPKVIRKLLKVGLAELPESNHQVFRRMYSPDDLERPIDAVVDAMPKSRLDWALTQVRSSLKNQEKNLDAKLLSIAQVLAVGVAPKDVDRVCEIPVARGRKL